MCPGLPRCLSSNESACQRRRRGFDPWVRKIPRRRKWQCTPIFLPGKSHRQRSLVSCSPWGSQRVGYNLGTEHTPPVCPAVLRNGKQGVKVPHPRPMNTESICLWNLLGWLKSQRIHLEPRRKRTPPSHSWFTGTRAKQEVFCKKSAWAGNVPSSHLCHLY